MKLPLSFLLCHLLLLPAGSRSVWFSSNISQLLSPHPPHLSSWTPMLEHTRGPPSRLTWHCWESLLPCPAVGSLPVSKPSMTVCGCPPVPASPICPSLPRAAIDSSPEKEVSSGSAVCTPKLHAAVSRFASSAVSCTVFRTFLSLLVDKF